MASLYDISKSLSSSETIECLQDVVFLILFLKSCIDKAINELYDEQFDFLHFAIKVEEIINDWADLMTVYSDSIQFEPVLDFDFQYLIHTWKEIVTIFVGHSFDWCLKHQILLEQFFYRLNELQQNYEQELKMLNRIAIREHALNND